VLIVRRSSESGLARPTTPAQVAPESSAEDVPRSLQFLFSRNRLNVAVSRAMCLALVVASPLLPWARAGE